MNCGRTTKAFTFSEVLCAIAIAMALTLIASPVAIQAIRRSKESSASSNLRQIWMATSLYQEAHDGGQRYGFAREMGLPDMFDFYKVDFHQSMRGSQPLMFSPCGQHPESSPVGSNLTYYASNSKEELWHTVAQQFEDRTILFVDSNCNEAKIKMLNPFHTKKLKGVLLSGQLVDRNAPLLLPYSDWSTYFK